ncbi:hypothetical protein ESA94_18055 [Lacibacter luteus]|uniref:Lipocalin-like domain-containing protein n=1 Tax=Lacibacter luteus TaxID=2508719 RepID=A0A4Q1CF74_9BACT|nr:hypothetical protein [Lacibacter luteus]RXK58536.1 hypothetical protein ESA94_18055 [Lacibacter luteus]
MKKLFIAACFFSVVLSSCKKESSPEPPSMIGFWKGKWGNAANYPSYGYAALFRSNGTVRFFDGADTATASKAEGTYIVSGSTVTATYTYTGSSNPISVSAAVNSKFTFLEGSWGTGGNATNGGLWILVKQ